MLLGLAALVLASAPSVSSDGEAFERELRAVVVSPWVLTRTKNSLVISESGRSMFGPMERCPNANDFTPATHLCSRSATLTLTFQAPISERKRQALHRALERELARLESRLAPYEFMGSYAGAPAALDSAYQSVQARLAKLPTHHFHHALSVAVLEETGEAGVPRGYAELRAAVLAILSPYPPL